MEEILNQILSELKTVKETMDVRFEAIDARFEAIDARFGTIDTRFDTLTHVMETGFAHVNRELDIVKAKLDTLYAQVAHNTEQEIRITNLETEVKLLKKTVANL